jgi:hypothetical protein
MEAQPAGARLVFSTTADVIELTTHPTRIAYRGADRPRGAIDVYVNGALTERDVLTGGDAVEVDLESGETSVHPGRSHATTVRGLPGGGNRVEIWLPHNESMEIVALRADARIDAGASQAPRWIHHGSCISQGSNAVAPSMTWPAVAAGRTNESTIASTARSGDSSHVHNPTQRAPQPRP